MLNNYDYSKGVVQHKMIFIIPKIITNEDNKILKKPFYMDEIKNSLLKMNLDKPLGLDGFKAFFFKKCWDIIGEYLWKELEATTNEGSLLTDINHTFLTLIPKKMDVDKPDHFTL